MAGRFVYLHGFASGPGSRKAQFFRDRISAEGYRMEIPDLSAGDFEHLTIGGQLRIVEELLRGEPATLIGSSMGGYLAALYGARHPETERLLLLAPAFRFAQHWQETLGAETLAKWQQTGLLPVYHYAAGGHRNLSYGIVEESRNWEPEPEFGQPAHIFHGTRDTVVPPEFSKAYVARHPHVELTLIDSDHELTDALDAIWLAWRSGSGSAAFPAISRVEAKLA